MTLKPAVFLDKDGTLVEDVPYNVDPALLRLTPHAVEGLRLLADHGYALLVVSNQSGIARGLFGRPQLARLRAALEEMLARHGVRLDGFYYCPHAPSPDDARRPACACRKPAPGLLHQAAQALSLDLPRSWMVGDILNDVEAGRRAGCRTVLLDVGHETEWRLSPLRTPHHRCADLLEAARTIVAARDGVAAARDAEAAARDGAAAARDAEAAARDTGATHDAAPAGHPAATGHATSTGHAARIGHAPPARLLASDARAPAADRAAPGAPAAHRGHAAGNAGTASSAHAAPDRTP